jgi:hypothetical protein
MYTIDDETYKRLELDLIDIKKPISQYTIDELTAHHNLLIEVARNLSDEIRAADNEIIEKENRREALVMRAETLRNRRQLAEGMVMKWIKENGADLIRIK